MLERQDTMKVLQKSFTSTDLSYSFSKSNRFSSIKEKPVGYYNVPALKSRRTTSFGFGKRTELINPNVGPSPDKYILQPSRPTGLAISKSEIGGRLKLCKNSNPGPGAYTIPLPVSPPAFSFKPRPKPPKIEISPCAANYNPSFTFTEPKKYSKISFGFGSKTNFSRNPAFPGPGSYSIPDIFTRFNKKKNLSGALKKFSATEPDSRE